MDDNCQPQSYSALFLLFIQNSSALFIQSYSALFIQSYSALSNMKFKIAWINSSDDHWTKSYNLQIEWVNHFLIEVAYITLSAFLRNTVARRNVASVDIFTNTQGTNHVLTYHWTRRIV